MDTPNRNIHTCLQVVRGGALQNKSSENKSTKVEKVSFSVGTDYFTVNIMFC